MILIETLIISDARTDGAARSLSVYMLWVVKKTGAAHLARIYPPVRARLVEVKSGIIVIDVFAHCCTRATRECRQFLLKDALFVYQRKRVKKLLQVRWNKY
jgi:hypothetical protein